MVIVNICENDDNGQPSGVVVGIEIEKKDLCFELNVFPRKVEFKYDKRLKVFVFDGISYPARLYNTWHGNLSWNAYEMQEGHFLKFINQVVECNHFYPINAGISLIEKIDTNTRLTAKDFDWDNFEDYQELTYNPNQLSLF